MSTLRTGRMSILKPEVNLESQNNFKELTDEEMKFHLGSMHNMLNILAKTIYEKLPDISNNNNSLEDHILRLAGTMHAVIYRNEIEKMKLSSENKSNCVIDPSESGFPLVVRDLHSLHSDKNSADAELARLPSDSQLVKDAEFSIFRGLLPTETINQKLQRDYFTMLSKLNIVTPLFMHSERKIVDKNERGFALYKQSVERLDDHNNMPRHYTLYFAVTPELEGTNNWISQVDEKIKSSFSGLAAYELPILARELEAIDGIQVQLIDRFDIGPFYNKLTENTDAMAKVLAEGRDTDSILAFRKYSINRESETEKKGFKNFWSSFISGDYHHGAFSPVIQSPKYLVLPYRSIQKIHNLKIDLGDETELFGINNTGDLIG